MATSIIKTTTAKGTGTNNGQGSDIYCNWERVGNMVTVSGVLSHEAPSWTIFRGIPTPLLDASVDSGGVVIGTLSNGNDIYAVNVDGGALQVRTSTFTTRHNFSGSYLCV